VINGQNGLLFDHNSVDDLTAQLASLSDDALVGRLGAEAYRRYWLEPLTEQAHIDKLEGLYRSVTNPGSRAHAAARGVLPSEAGVHA